MNDDKSKKGQDAAAKFFSMFDANKSKTIDVVEFGEVLASAWKKVEREELDAIFRVIDRQNRGFLTE